MKKGVFIGLGIGFGAVALGVGIWLLIWNLTKFSVKTDGFIVSSNNYAQFITSCEMDATMNDRMSAGNPMDIEEIKPYKTEYYTEDGYPIWAVGQTWNGYSGKAGATYICHLGTNGETAFLIDLMINNKIVKTYNSAAVVVDKNGNKASLTN